MTSFEPEISCSHRSARTVVPTLLLDPWASSSLVSSEDLKGLAARGRENGEAARRRQVLAAGVSSSTTRSR
jgi:hypothetical protein